MTTKPYKFNEDENNSSRVSEPVTAYGKSYNAIYNNELSEAGLRFEAKKAELAHAILSIDNEQQLTNVINRLFGILNIKKKTPKTKEIADTNKELLLDEGLHKLAGIWRNDPEADKIYEAIQNGRQSGITRHIIPFDK